MRAVNVGGGGVGSRAELGRCLAAKAAERGRRHKCGSAQRGGNRLRRHNLPQRRVQVDFDGDPRILVVLFFFLLFLPRG